MSGAHPVPSDAARRIVEGAYDLHVHVLPDVFERKITDLQLAERFRELRLGGFVVKSHYTMTAERAAVVRAATGVDVLGGITLNSVVGGINPPAVEICARSGGRFVWLPTFDSVNEARSVNNVRPTGTPPAWAALRADFARKGLTAEPVRVVDDSGDLLPEVRDMLRVVADHRLVLCTGHLSAAEISVVVRGAREEGVGTIIITHPDFPSQNIPVEEQIRLADQGCLLERCFGTPYAGRVAWEVMFANIRAAGVGASVITSDLGQVHNPPVEDGLALMADRLLAAGFTETDVHTMTVANSRRVVGADVTREAIYNI
jgi:Family of unknown function (DUF6282)